MKNAVAYVLKSVRGSAVITLASVFCVISAQAASVTVSSGTWSSAGVKAGDDVTITGTCENDMDGIVLASLSVSADEGRIVEISGKAFSFGTGGLIRTGSGTVKFLTDVHGTGPVSLSKGPTYVSGPECGLGDSGSIMTISDYKSRLFLDGTVIMNSKIRSTEKYNQAGGLTGNVVFSFFADSLENTVNHIYAKLEAVTTARYIVLNPAPGSKIYLHGGAVWSSNTSGSTLSSRPFGGDYASNVKGELIIVDTPIAMHSFQNVDMKNGCPVTTVSVAGMKVRDYIGFGQEDSGMLSKLVTTVDWAFNASDESENCARFTTRDNKRTSGGTIDIGSTRQRFGGFYNTVTMSGTITGTSGGIFYCRQWKNDMSSVGVALNVTGAATFVKEGTNSLMLTGAASTTTGDLKVSEGSLVLSSAARFANVGSVIVGAAADDNETVVSEYAVTPKLSIGAADNFGSLAVLRLNGNGVVEIPSGVQHAFDRIYIDGVEMPVGEYGATTCPWMIPEGQRAAVTAHFSGSGKIVALNGVTENSKATGWTGNGDGVHWNNADNWSNGVPRNNDDVIINIEAYEGDEKEMVNDIDGLTLKSLMLSGAGSFTLSGKSISILEGGLVSGTDDGDAAAVTNSVNFDISLAAGQTWSIRGTKRELRLYGSLNTTVGAYPLIRSGSGIWRLYADTYGDGDITLANDNGATYAYSPNCAFGGEKSTLTICGKSLWGPNVQGGAKLHLCGTVISNGVVKFDGYYVRINSGERECWLYSDAATRENVVHGQIRFNDSSKDCLYLSNPVGQTLVFVGGCSGVRNIVHAPEYNTNPYNYSEAGCLIMTNGAWKINGSIGFESFQCCLGSFIWGAPGSTVGGAICWHVNEGASAAITFAADWTLGLDGDVSGNGIFKNRFSGSTQYYRGCPVHFGSTKQRIGGFAKDVLSGAYFDGTEGSAFYCRQSSADVTVAAAVNGELSFIKEGDRRITFTQASNTTGTLGVAGGELVLAESAIWANCTNVFVSADATLSVSNRAAFAEGLVVALEDGATLDLAYSGTMKVLNLTFNGKSAHAGVWGAPGSRAQYTSPLIVGTGLMKVGKAGFSIVIR